MVQEGGISIFAGREGAGKSLLGHQAAIELARGYGNFVAEDISPQNVIIIDGEMDEDDYVSLINGFFNYAFSFDSRFAAVFLPILYPICITTTFMAKIMI